MITGTNTSPPILQECPYNLEYKVTQEIELGDYTLFMSEIVQTHVDEAQ